jgi:hypothetical protein
MRLRALQTRVDPTLEKLAKQAAAREGEDVSNWLRRLVTRELRPHVLVEAWTLGKGEARDAGLDPDRAPEFFLHPFRESTNGLDRDFIVYAKPDERLSPARVASTGDYWEQVQRRRIILRGSPTPWQVTGQMAYVDGRVVLTLRRVT